MVYLVLDYLCSKACVGLDAGLHIKGLIFHLDALVSLAFSGTAEQRKTALLGVICSFGLDYLGIEHNGIRRILTAFVKKGDDSFFYTYHVRRHTHTALTVLDQCVKSICSCL